MPKGLSSKAMRCRLHKSVCTYINDDPDYQTLKNSVEFKETAYRRKSVVFSTKSDRFLDELSNDYKKSNPNVDIESFNGQYKVVCKYGSQNIIHETHSDKSYVGLNFEGNETDVLGKISVKSLFKRNQSCSALDILQNNLAITESSKSQNRRTSFTGL